MSTHGYISYTSNIMLQKMAVGEGLLLMTSRNSSDYSYTWVWCLWKFSTAETASRLYRHFRTLMTRTMIPLTACTRFDSSTSRDASQRYYQPHQHVSLDERIVRIKGRHAMKVYVKNTPTKWGFKYYALCDSSIKYIWNYELFTRQQYAPGPLGITHDLVMRFFQPLANKGYALFTDNYYTGQGLATSLVANLS